MSAPSTTPAPSDAPEPTFAQVRLYMGEAWVHCNECGGKLWSFDGDRDTDRSCPYRRNGRCEPR